jgi:uncharacterized membrane protein YhhN
LNLPFTLSLLLALAYGAFGPGWREAGVAAELLAALKASGIVVLAWLAWRANGAGLERAAPAAHAARSAALQTTFVAAGLAFGALGDVLLALGRETFLFGATAFLIGHLLYITYFIRNGVGLAALRREPARAAIMLAIAGPAIALNALLVPADHALFAPLFVYALVLTAMTATSFLLPSARWPAMLGAFLFLISDGFVAAQVFHADSAIVANFWFGFAGWMLYWAGQAGICIGTSAPARRV